MGQAQEKLDHAIEPAYALVTLILSWESTTKIPVNASSVDDEWVT